jgi:hypothetical protein
MRALDWIKNMDYAAYFPEEYNEMIELIGIDKFLTVYERFSKTQIYFSEKPLNALRREYILKNPETEAKELARKLDVSDRYIYKVRGGRDPDTIDMFTEDEN